MAYSTGLLNKRIQVHNPATAIDGDYGRVGGGYTYVTSLWASVDWSRGTHAMRQGALDAYDTIMIRCRYCAQISKDSHIKYDDRMYQIETIHQDLMKNTCQITASELQ